MRRLRLDGDFNLAHTLECGQVFRWERIEDWYAGVVDGAVLKVKQDGPILFSENNSAGLDLRSYFALDLNLDEIYRSIDVDEHIHKAIEKYRGLRIIRQNPWECLASYILSSYNNIPRIKLMIENISRRFGRRLDGGFYSFPGPGDITTEAHKCRLGFRSRYLCESALMVLRGEISLDSLSGEDYHIIKMELMKFPGVGEKVADCVSLFAFAQYEAFPVDVWVKRAMERLYFRGRALGLGRMREFARRHFGRYAGWAGEYLYSYIRGMST